jgi:hypothetical protein
LQWGAVGRQREFVKCELLTGRKAGLVKDGEVFFENGKITATATDPKDQFNMDEILATRYAWGRENESRRKVTRSLVYGIAQDVSRDLFQSFYREGARIEKLIHVSRSLKAEASRSIPDDAFKESTTYTPSNPHHRGKAGAKSTTHYLPG